MSDHTLDINLMREAYVAYCGPEGHDEFDRWLAEHDREVWKAGALRAAIMCINEELFARLDGDGFGAVIELPHEEDGRRRRATFRRGDLPSLIAAIAERPEPEK